MIENFNALIKKALKETPRKTYLPKMQELGLCERVLKPSALDNKVITRWSWAYKICKALDIDAYEAYKALLADLELSTLNDRELIEKAPDKFLYRYAFYGLRVQQLLASLDTVSDSEKADIIKSARTLTSTQEKIFAFIDSLSLQPQMKAVLRLRYFEAKTIKETANTLTYVRRWTLTLLAESLKIVSESAEFYYEE